MSIILEMFARDYPTPDLLDLWHESSPNLDARRVEWSYRGNPSGPAKVFVLRDTQRDGVVGSLTIFPKIYSWRGVDILGGITGDFSVRKEQRTLGPALNLQNAAVGSEEYGVLLGFANACAAPVQRRSGFVPLCRFDRFYLVLRSQRILKRRFPGKLFWMASPFLDLFQRVSRGGRRLAGRRRKRFKMVDELDARVDILWSEMRKHFDLVGRRDEAHLRWRYEESPYKRYAFYGSEDLETTELLGLLAYRVDDSKIAWIDDFVFADPDVFFGSVLPAFVDWADQAGLDAVSLMLARNGELAKGLLRAGFRRQEMGGTLLWRHTEGLHVDTERWSVCITGGDDDS